MVPVDILIIDNHEEDINSFREILKRNDIVIYSASSVDEGLEVALENPVSIVLINAQMPGINECGFTEKVNANPDTKSIFLIWITDDSEGARAAVREIGTGAVDYLCKPFDPLITCAKIDFFVQMVRYRLDIERKNAELQNFAVMVKNSSDVICSVDPQTLSIQSVNPAVEQLLGFMPNDLIGNNVTDIVTETQQAAFSAKLAALLTHNTSSLVFKLQLSSIDKKTVLVDCRANYQYNTILINITGIPPRKENNLHLVKSKENAAQGKKAKETFLANMSHELRTPVNGIIGLTALLRKTTLDEQQNSMIDLMEVSSQSLLGVINDVLDISKMDAGKFTIHRSSNNLHDLLRSVYGLLKFKADEGNIEFLLEIAPDVPVYVMVDSLRLNQILMNLLSNAIKFTKRGFVKLNVTADQKYDKQIKLKFTVEDSGIGINPTKLSTIFDSFEQAEEDTAAKYGGTGLGLAIVKRLVELKGGEIAVSSQPGCGSVFTFTNWYAIGVKPQDKRSSRYAAMERFDNVSILVAEDNLVNQFMLAKMLKDWNLEVDMVDNGMKVIDKMHQNQYDLILMDTHMPEMNGYDTAKAIRVDFEEPKRSIPIISLSAASFEYEQQEAVLAGMNDVISKPFKPAELHEKMKRLLREAHMVKSIIDA